MATYSTQMMQRGNFVPTQANMAASNVAPAGTFAPGTKVQVGNHRVIIDRYLSEGGFAHVYVVSLPRSIDGEEKGVLKRVAVPDKQHLANMRTEVETMKRLRGHKHIVKYIDSHASPLKTGGFEVFLLMEFCQGGGLIDFMNTRLQNRLTEPEIVKIFADVAEGVARMHYLKPPLLHRDLKVENVLISTVGKDRIFKICDFGSAAPPRPAATSAAEGRLIEDDVQRHTTLQYRSPEMIDVYRKQPIDEKSDIWALGVFLYKLCYYTTPFEEVGQMAILNASFKYPGYPRFSDQLKLLIASMLREQPSQRPNIYQVLRKACQLDHRELSVRDIYSDRTHSEARKNEILPEPDSAQSRAGATLSPPKQGTGAAIPDIAPMRRGRPSRPTSHHNSAKPSPSPLRVIEGSDPFAHLDNARVINADELSSRFPTLDQFSLMTDKSSRFSFQPDQPKVPEGKDEDLSRRVTDALADEAFVRPSSTTRQKPEASAVTENAEAAQRPVKDKVTDLNRESVQANISVSIPETKKPVMVSTGTMTSASPVPRPVTDRPIHRFPPQDSASKSTTSLPPPKPTRPAITTSKSGSRLATLLRSDAARSQVGDEETPQQSSSSARPSMEGGRPLLKDLDKGISRSRSLNLRNRPTSINMGSGATRAKDKDTKPVLSSSSLVNSEAIEPEVAVVDSDTNIASDIDFLKAKEEEEKDRSRHIKRHSSGSKHHKRTSLPSITLTGTKNMLHGRFGDAFKKFEDHDGEGATELEVRDENSLLTPIAGSEATDLSEDRNGFDETEDLSPEMRRELEKRKLEAEEKRVANAAAEYRQRVNARGPPPPVPSTKAASIQNRVRSLLQESGKPVQKTATGYGQFTDSTESNQPAIRPLEKAPVMSPSRLVQASQPIQSISSDSRSYSAPASAVNLQRSMRPVAPPKPRVLQLGRNDGGPVATNSSESALAGGVEPSNSSDDWEAQFSQKYPSLSHLEMVDMEIKDIPQSSQLRTKEI